MKKYDINIHKVFVVGLNLEEKVKRQELRFLLDELYETDITPSDWKELYEKLLQNLQKFQDKWGVIRFIYRFLNLRYDYLTAERIVWKITKRFEILFTKYDSFYGPTSLGIELFESLMNPLDKQKITLTKFLSKFQPGVGA